MHSAASPSAKRVDCRFTLSVAIQRAPKLPSLHGRFICRLQLEAGAGRIQQTGAPSHHTWWPLADLIF